MLLHADITKITDPEIMTVLTNHDARGSGEIFGEKFAPVVVATTGANFSWKILPLPLHHGFHSCHDAP